MVIIEANVVLTTAAGGITSWFIFSSLTTMTYGVESSEVAFLVLLTMNYVFVFVVMVYELLLEAVSAEVLLRAGRLVKAERI